MTIAQNNKCKFMGINLFDISKNEVSSISAIKKGFPHRVAKAIQKF